jgi:uncharacterized protein
MNESDTTRFQTTTLLNPDVRKVWDSWHKIALPDCWLVAGCLAQTVWNARFGFAAEFGISDMDIVYFDPTDVSESSEQGHAERVRSLLPSLSTKLDIKNEARVHLWYEQKFGYSISPYQSITDAIDTFPTTATAVGMQPAQKGAQIYTTFGLTDLFEGIVRANRRQITRDIYQTKLARWLRYWPDLTIIPWEDC